MGRSLRLPSSTSSPSRNTTVRNPSHLGSKLWGPSGSPATGLASIGATGGITGRSLPPSIQDRPPEGRRAAPRRGAGRGIPPMARAAGRPSAGLVRGPHPDLVQVGEEVGRILVHAVGARPLQLLPPVAARQQPDPQRPRPP